MAAFLDFLEIASSHGLTLFYEPAVELFADGIYTDHENRVLISVFAGLDIVMANERLNLGSQGLGLLIERICSHRQGFIGQMDDVFTMLVAAVQIFTTPLAVVQEVPPTVHSSDLSFLSW